MCGRYTFTAPSDRVQQLFHVDASRTIIPRYNIAPTQASLIVREQLADQKPVRELVAAQWGLVPGWAKDPSIGSRMINARCETVAEKPAYRAAFKYHRCLIPANGFYEWQTIGKSKQPFYITMKDRDLFAFAGLYDVWERPEGYIESF
ncbi:MAG: SOS response-associated peptidase, partial [Chthonomonadales bacterium]